ncbi:MAG: hypothetical protein KKF43_12690, partial [Proteobacteria bacterium]|nr:hypothetical protein [Pseudomonadota bacterium]
VQDNETKGGIFPGKVISVDSGKLTKASNLKKNPPRHSMVFQKKLGKYLGGRGGEIPPRYSTPLFFPLLFISYRLFP